MGGGWSADDCLRRAAILERSSSTASEKGRDKPDGAAQTAQPDTDDDDDRIVVIGANTKNYLLDGDFRCLYEPEDGTWYYQNENGRNLKDNQRIIVILYRSPRGAWCLSMDKAYFSRLHAGWLISEETDCRHPLDVRTWSRLIAKDTFAAAPSFKALQG